MMFTVTLFIRATTPTKNLMARVEQIQTSNSEPKTSKLINRFCCPFPFPGFHIALPFPSSIFMTSDILHSNFHSYNRYWRFLIVWRCLSPQRWVAKPFLPGSAENTCTNVPTIHFSSFYTHSVFLESKKEIPWIDQRLYASTYPFPAT